MTVYGYTRVSTVEQADGTSLAEQERKIQGVAMIRGDEAPVVFTDAGISGSTPLDQRPQGGQLLAQLKRGDTLIVAKLDRAFRNATDALTRSDAFKAQGVKLILADIGNDPVTENGTGRMFFGMLALMAEFERERILERTNDGRKAKRAQGGHTGGTAPFGYKVEGRGKEARLVAVEAEQRALTTIRQMAGLGASSRLISAKVQELHGLKISHAAICRLLAKEPVDA